MVDDKPRAAEPGSELLMWKVLLVCAAMSSQCNLIIFTTWVVQWRDPCHFGPEERLYSRSTDFPHIIPCSPWLFKNCCFNMLSDSAGYVNSLLVPWPHAWCRLPVFDMVEWYPIHSDNVSYLLLGTKPRQKWHSHSFHSYQEKLLLQHFPLVICFLCNTKRKTIY